MERIWYGYERYGIGNGIVIVPTPQGRFDVGRLLPFAYGTVRSLGVAVISRDLTRTYSGKCMECDRTGLGGLAIESLRRIRLHEWE